MKSYAMREYTEAKFWSTSGKDYARTPKQIIKLILEDHYKKKYK